MMRWHHAGTRPLQLDRCNIQFPSDEEKRPAKEAYIFIRDDAFNWPREQ